MGCHPANPQDIWVSLPHAPLLATLSPPRSQTPRRPAVRTAMFHGTRPGWIEVIAGVMFSGKSEELVRRVRRAVIARKHVQVFKSHLDARYAGLYTVSTHDGGLVEGAGRRAAAGAAHARPPPAPRGGGAGGGPRGGRAGGAGGGGRGAGRAGGPGPMP